MDFIFYRILTLSFAAGIMILMIIPLRLLLRNGSRRVMMIFWLLVGLRLILPFSFESRASLIPEELSNPVNLSVTLSEKMPFSAILQEDSEVTGEKTVESTSENVVEEGVSNNSFWPDRHIILSIYIPAIWLLGMGGLLFYMILCAVKLHRDEINAVHLTDNIYRIKEGKTAYVSGLIRPRIYLPTNITQEEAGYVLAHERGHIQWKDHIVKCIACLLLCVYWFNPLIWVGFILFCCDLEYACDEYVTRKFIPLEKSRYSEILLNLSKTRNTVYLKPVTFGDVNIKKRIRFILQERRKSSILNVCIVMAALCLTAFSMSSVQTAGTRDGGTGSYSAVKDTVNNAYSISYDGYRCISRFEKYQPGVNDIRIVLKTEGKAVRVENSIRLEKEETDGSWVVIPRTERYLKALMDAGRPTDNGEGFLSMGEDDAVSLFWLCKMRLEDEPLEEGNYHVVFTTNGKEQQFPFIVSKDGWNGRPEYWTDLISYPSVLYQGEVYYRSSARTSQGTLRDKEADPDLWKEVGTTRNVDIDNNVLAQNMDCLTMYSGNRVFYDETNDMILVELAFEGETSYIILDEKISSDELK